MTDILDKMTDLHKQATRERSHYYTGSILTEAMQEISSLRQVVREAIVMLELFGTFTFEEIEDVPWEENEPPEERSRKVAARLSEVLDE